jgi:hypothetical protein
MANTDLEFVRGDDWDMLITVSDESGATSISGYTFWCSLKEKSTDSYENSVLTSSVINHFAPNLGKTLISFPKEKTSLLTPKSYYYDVQYKDRDGKVSTPVIGKLKVVIDITDTY